MMKKQEKEKAAVGFEPLTRGFSVRTHTNDITLSTTICKKNAKNIIPLFPLLPLLP